MAIQRDAAFPENVLLIKRNANGVPHDQALRVQRFCNARNGIGAVRVNLSQQHTMSLPMTSMNTDAQINERQEDFLTLINMLTYAEGVADSLGAPSASWYIDVAKQALKSALQSEMDVDLSNVEIINLASVRAGHC
jgi:hypothetical protein